MPKSPLSSPQSSPESKSKLSESRRKIVASEEDREAGERSTAQSPALPALCASPPSSIELLPVLVDPVQGVESIRESSLLLGGKVVDIGRQKKTQNRCPARGHPCEIFALS